MALQSTAIFGNADAEAMVARLAAAVGPDPSEADRLATWMRLKEEGGGG